MATTISKETGGVRITDGAKIFDIIGQPTMIVPSTNAVSLFFGTKEIAISTADLELDSTGTPEEWEGTGEELAAELRDVFFLISEDGADIDIDESPIEDSENAVSSGGVFSALAGKASSSHTHAFADLTGTSNVAVKNADNAFTESQTITKNNGVILLKPASNSGTLQTVQATADGTIRGGIRTSFGSGEVAVGAIGGGYYTSIYSNTVEVIRVTTGSRTRWMAGISEYADNAAAKAALTDDGIIYRTGDLLKITHS